MNANGCTGMCCACFHLQGQQPAIVAISDPTKTEVILDMLRPVAALDADTGWQMYTCRHWDHETRLGRIYEERPQMCRSFPNEQQKCGLQGCTFEHTREELVDGELPEAV